MLKDRVLEYCKFKNISISQFEKLAGLSSGYFDHCTKRPSDTRLVKISKAHPDLNLAWLLTGVGSMLEEAGQSPDAPAVGNIVVDDVLIKENSDLRRVNKTLTTYIEILLAQNKGLMEMIKNLTAR